MADPDLTATMMALLRHVADRKVLTNESDLQVYLELPGEPDAQVSDMVCAMEDAGWVREPADSVVWEPTRLGREVLDRGAP